MRKRKITEKTQSHASHTEHSRFQTSFSFFAFLIGPLHNYIQCLQVVLENVLRLLYCDVTNETSANKMQLISDVNNFEFDFLEINILRQLANHD